MRNDWPNLTQTLALPIADQPEKCVVVVTVDTTGLVKIGAMSPRRRLHGSLAASSHVLAMGFLGDSGEVSVETVQTARLHGTVRSYGVLKRTAAAGAKRSNSESTLLHGEDDSLNPILSVEPFHRLLDVPIDGSV